MEIIASNLAGSPLREKFLKWQCLTRQMMMRDHGGRPGHAIMPKVFLQTDGEKSRVPLGSIITILNRLPEYSMNAELEHIVKSTHDPAQMRNRALQFLAATYYQKHHEFSDVITATFPPQSTAAIQLVAAGNCWLSFDAYAQTFDLRCKVWQLEHDDPLHQATTAHNQPFNPGLSKLTLILGFKPDWVASSAG